ncbi:MAG: hypothetical protein ABIP48_03360, partial [Planctomycetota bacterium]
LFLLCSDLFTALGGSSYSTYFTALNGKHFGQHNTDSRAEGHEDEWHCVFLHSPLLPSRPRFGPTTVSVSPTDCQPVEYNSQQNHPRDEMYERGNGRPRRL